MKTDNDKLLAAGALIVRIENDLKALRESICQPIHEGKRRKERLSDKYRKTLGKK